jgi:hypothetical protein
MSILSRNALKAEFISGTAATESKFGDLFDSSYNLNDDSVVLGPTGITGTYGLWFTVLGATPISLSATGSTGQVAAGNSGLWLCIAQNTWILIPTSPALGGTVTGHLIPNTDVAYDLGATGYRFRDLYISGTTIYMGNSKMSTDNQGNFIFVGPTGGTTIIGPSAGGTVTSPLVFEDGSSIESLANSSSDGNGFSTMSINPDTSLESDQYLVIDPTGPNHIHIRAGGTAELSTADLIIGAENNHLRVSDGGNEVEISAAGSYNWTFKSDGTLQFPDGSTQSIAYTGADPNAISITYGPGPAGPTAPGATGQMIMETILGPSPEIGNLFIYDPTQSRWVKFVGAAFDW